MLVILEALPVAAPDESVFAKFAVAQVVAVDFTRKIPRAVGIRASGCRIDDRLSVADDDARIEQRVDVHRITETVIGQFARVSDFAIVEGR